MAATPTAITPDEGVGSAFAYYATATALDLRTVSGKPQRCPRRIVAMAAGTWSVLKDQNEVDGAPGTVFQGFVHDAHTAIITSSAAIQVYW